MDWLTEEALEETLRSGARGEVLTGSDRVELGRAALLRGRHFKRTRRSREQLQRRSEHTAWSSVIDYVRFSILKIKTLYMVTCRLPPTT